MNQKPRFYSTRKIPKAVTVAVDQPSSSYFNAIDNVTSPLENHNWLLGVANILLPRSICLSVLQKLQKTTKHYKPSKNIRKRLD